MADNPTVDDVVAKAQLPRGDHVTVGGAADEVGEPQVIVQPAQIAPGVDAEQGGEVVNEVYVITDQVVRDPQGPLGVQIPSAAVNDVWLPIHDLAKGTPDQQLARDEEAATAEPGMVAGDNDEDE